MHLEKSIEMNIPTVSEKDKAVLTKHLLSHNYAALTGKYLLYTLLNDSYIFIHLQVLCMVLIP